jgi:hypothetical protein
VEASSGSPVPHINERMIANALSDKRDQSKLQNRWLGKQMTAIILRHLAGLPTQIAHDKGRYRQLRARSQPPEHFQPQTLQNTRNLESSARMSRVGTEFVPP